jgi:hypothetical protein
MTMEVEVVIGAATLGVRMRQLYPTISCSEVE